ncbi:hypothetical protein MP638_006210 [Amoeboaphelidium occidentale]|nr:hypothetical protein MP638_006210 [Amoeboaphelidium occidentale]
MANKNSSLTATLKDHRNFYIIALVTIGLSRDLTLLPLLLLPFVKNYKKIIYAAILLLNSITLMPLLLPYKKTYGNSIVKASKYSKVIQKTFYLLWKNLRYTMLLQLLMGCSILTFDVAKDSILNSLYFLLLFCIYEELTEGDDYEKWYRLFQQLKFNQKYKREIILKNSFFAFFDEYFSLFQSRDLPAEKVLKEDFVIEKDHQMNVPSVFLSERNRIKKVTREVVPDVSSGKASALASSSGTSAAAVVDPRIVIVASDALFLLIDYVDIKTREKYLQTLKRLLKEYGSNSLVQRNLKRILYQVKEDDTSQNYKENLFK